MQCQRDTSPTEPSVAPGYPVVPTARQGHRSGSRCSSVTHEHSARVFLCKTTGQSIANRQIATIQSDFRASATGERINPFSQAVHNSWIGEAASLTTQQALFLNQLHAASDPEYQLESADLALARSILLYNRSLDNRRRLLLTPRAEPQICSPLQHEHLVLALRCEPRQKQT